jgi:hypothetical protein
MREKAIKSKHSYLLLVILHCQQIIIGCINIHLSDSLTSILLQPKPGRPDGLALDMGWTAEDKTMGLAGWSLIRKPGRIQVGRQVGW